MEEKTTVEQLTVEQVRAAASEQISILYDKLQEANLANTFKRLDYLFKIIELNFNNDMKAKAMSLIDEIVFGSNEEKK